MISFNNEEINVIFNQNGLELSVLNWNILRPASHGATKTNDDDDDELERLPSSMDFTRSTESLFKCMQNIKFTTLKDFQASFLPEQFQVNFELNGKIDIQCYWYPVSPVKV